MEGRFGGFMGDVQLHRLSRAERTSSSSREEIFPGKTIVREDAS